jgi:hypothetical protein
MVKSSGLSMIDSHLATLGAKVGRWFLSGLLVAELIESFIVRFRLGISTESSSQQQRTF